MYNSINLTFDLMMINKINMINTTKNILATELLYILIFKN